MSELTVNSRTLQKSKELEDQVMKSFDYKKLRENVFASADKTYGEPLPDKVRERLEFELGAIEDQGIGFVFEALKKAMDKKGLKAADMCCRGVFEHSLVGFLQGLTDLDPVKEDLNPWFLYGRDGKKRVSVSYNVPCEKLSGFLHDIIELTEGEKVYIKSYSEGIELGNRDTCSAEFIILGYSDVDVLRRLFKETGVKPEDIHLDDPKLISLFQSTGELGILPEDLKGFPLGTAGLNSFDTAFCSDVTREIGVASFCDVVKIHAILHGTGTYAHAAHLLLDAGITDTAKFIATRDDIMDCLVKYGIEPETAFDIAEDVRKSKVSGGRSVVWQKHQPELIDKVPELYLKAIAGISFCFPKGHSLEYSLRAMQLAYFKVYYPEKFYAAWLEEKPDPRVEQGILLRTQTDEAFFNDKYEHLEKEAEMRLLVEREKKARIAAKLISG